MTVAWLDQVKATNPTKPWFVYFSTGEIHGPHQVPKTYRDKYKGQFDAGWDTTTSRPSRSRGASST